jgi:hypothetical protein
MKESQGKLAKESFDHRKVILGGMLIVLALLVTSRAAAAPATTSKKSTTSARVTATTLDASALRPIWIFGNNAAKAPARVATARIGQRPRIVSAQANAPLVQVPARPLPRDPFAPPT